MKTLSLMAVLFLGLVAQAGQYDGIQIQCRKGSFELQFSGKKGWLGSPSVSLKKNSELLVDESADVITWRYNERQGNATPGELRALLSYGSKVKPRSVRYDYDLTYISSENTILIETYDSLQPGFGGETPALLMQLKPTGEFVSFELGKDCTKTRL